MLIDIVSIFPAMFTGVFDESIIKRAADKGLVQIRVRDLRDFSTDKHRRVDDSPFGGGAGMVMKPEPFFAAVESIRKQSRECGDSGEISGLSDSGELVRTTGSGGSGRVIIMSPRGRLLEQQKVKELSSLSHLILLCGHYEGVDERVHLHLADEEISVGDYVLTGGELPAMVLVDAVVRLIPGVLSEDSLEEESFSEGLLEYPQYTRPREYLGMTVPEVLLSGNHEQIRRWRSEQALQQTVRNRPDLFNYEIKNL